MRCWWRCVAWSGSSVASARLCTSVWCSSRIVEPSFVTKCSAFEIDATSMRCSKGRRERLRDALLRVTLERGEERQREGAGAVVLGDRTEPFAEPVALAHVGLEVDRRQVA